ncbi:MAG: DNA starvation/stationary phase protection protein [Clostridiales bacterium]|nr:MAG: DNA starvation/stationary phase protection protein [Clostridiales bacterium]
MKLEKEFNHYLANLGIFTMKLHNIHWNVEGERFVAVHEFTDDEYNKFFERMDEIAELLKMYEVMPKSTMKEYLEIASIVEEPTRKFECREGLKIVLDDIESIRKNATELRNLSDEARMFSAVSLLEDHISDYNKVIWFLKATLA